MTAPVTAPLLRPARPVPPRRLSTPKVLKALLALLVVGPVILGILGQQAVSGQESALRTMGRDTAPDVASATDIAFSLADMDANAANYLLVGDRDNLGLSSQDALDFYSDRRSTVVAQLATVAANAGSEHERQQVQDILDGLGRFEALVAQARLLSDQAYGTGAGGTPDITAAVAKYTEATDLMHDELLPAANRLGSDNADGLRSTYDDARSAATRRLVLLWVVGLALLAVLVAAQVYVRRRTQRVLNPGLLAATLVTGGLLVGLTLVLRDGAESLRAANQDAFASVLALSEARTIAYDANGDESRFLLDPSRADRYAQAFLDRSSQLVALDGVSLGTFDAEFAAALEQAKGSEADEDVVFDGQFGTALRNITFPGERERALATLDAYAVYQVKDRDIRAKEAADHEEAIRFCLSYDEGDSNWSYALFDEALVQFRDLNQQYFERFVREGEDGLKGWAVGALAAGALIAVLAVLGLWWRLAEYRRSG